MDSTTDFGTMVQPTPRAARPTAHCPLSTSQQSSLSAAGWAADSLLPLEQVTCLEREAAMRAVGSRLREITVYGVR